MKLAFERTRRCVVASALMCLALPGVLQAQDFPTRPINMVVPFPAGGSLDTVGRPLSRMFEQATGQPLILENVGGAGGLIGAAKVVKSPADGHSLLLASNGQVTIAPLVYKDMAYDPKTDLMPIVHLVDQTAVLYASTKSSYQTFADVEKAAKASGDPVSFASTGNGSISHLALELLGQQMGATFAHVPYRGAAPALQDLAGGQVPLLFTFVGSAKPLTASGMVRPIAVASAARLPTLPDVPTFAELGYPGVQASVWIGLMAPKGTPEDRVKRVADVVNDIITQPEFKALMADNNMEVKGGSLDSFKAMMASDGARWSKLGEAVSLTSK